MADFENLDALIIGAGWNGVGTAAALKASGVNDFLVLEKGSGVGSFWRNLYDRLHFHNGYMWLWNTPEEWKKDYEYLKPRAQVVSYLERYAKHNGLIEHMRFNTEVLSVKFAGNFDSRSDTHEATEYRWHVRTSEKTYRAKVLAVATSINAVPVVPKFEGLADFGGELITAKQYRNGSALKGKDVLVVGAGNSAFEQALDCVESGANVSILIRNPIHVISGSWTNFLLKTMHNLSGAVTKKDLLNNMHVTKLTKEYWDHVKSGDASMSFVAQDLSAVGLRKPKKGPMTHFIETLKFPTLDWGLVTHLRSGKVKVIHCGIDRFTKSGVTLVDGKNHDFDVVVLATGYTHGLEGLMEDSKQLLAPMLIDSQHVPKNVKPNTKPLPRTNGIGQSVRASTLFFPGFDVNQYGGISFGIFAWRIGEQMAVELGAIKQEEMTLRPLQATGGDILFYAAIALGLGVVTAALYLGSKGSFRQLSNRLSS